MLGISRQTDYAVRVVLHLASLEPGAMVPISGISVSRELPFAFVRRLIRPLVAKGILASSRGSSGGVRLARPAGDISLLDVVRAIEGSLALNQCADGSRGCPNAPGCPVHGAWTGATRMLEEHLGGIRFDALAGTRQ